jgi:hypothetical protein
LPHKWIAFSALMCCASLLASPSTILAKEHTSRKVTGEFQREAAVLPGGAEHYGLVERKNGDWKIRDKPPLVHHLSHHELHARQAFASYAETLQEDRRVLLQRYRRRDVVKAGRLTAGEHPVPST